MVKLKSITIKRT